MDAVPLQDVIVGNRSIQKKPAVLGRVKLDKTDVTCCQRNFNRTIAWSRNRNFSTHVKDTCATTVPPKHQTVLPLVNQTYSAE